MTFMLKIPIYCTLKICGIYLIAINPVLAQITPDSTLGRESSTIQHSAGVDTISGGATRGTNLFHSFQQFSTPDGNTAFFNNGLNIENIITRITGGQTSNINGLIKANGTTNLFLINPNGIVFGANARLDIGGSFLGTTANAIKFTDGTFFSATAPQNQPLLTITIPIGLDFGSDLGGIEVQGTGHSLVNPIFAPIIGLSNSTGLQVQPGKTLALLGGNVTLNGGVLTAESGRVELGSVGNGLVALNSDSSGWKLGYEDVRNFKDIWLSRQALVNTSGIPGGSIQVNGQIITASDGSALFIQNQGEQLSGEINVNASDLLEVTGTSPDGRIASTLLTETLNGDGGNITVSAKRIVVQDGGQILPRTFSPGTGGNLIVNASESVQVIGFSPAFPNLFSNISAATYGLGNAGKLTLSTSKLTGIDGIQIGSATFGSGSGGSVTINATDITLSGLVPGLLTPSTINAATFSNGNAGQVIINAARLRLENGGAVDSSTTASGNAGSVIVNASDFVVVDGIGSGSITPSLINSSAIVLAQPLQQQLRIPSVPTGNAGDVIINTANLSISNGGLVSVRNDGLGNAGSIQVNVNGINITNNGGISATTEIGEGGDIAVQSNILQLNNGIISATAGQQGTDGDGGNITINTDILVAIRNSSITANAFKGRGGNIDIDAMAFFVSPNSRLEASSQLGIDGTIQVDARFTNFNFNKVQLEGISETPKIASVCQSRSGGATSKFVVTDIDSLLPSPNDWTLDKKACSRI